MAVASRDVKKDMIINDTMTTRSLHCRVKSTVSLAVASSLRSESFAGFSLGTSSRSGVAAATVGCLSLSISRV